MKTGARITVTGQSRTTLLSALLPEADLRRMRGELARAAIAEAAAQNRAVLGVEPPRREVVDGHEGAALESVRPDGVVYAEWSLIEELVSWVGRALVLASPIGPGRNGHYKDSHIVMVDGVRLGAGAAIPELFEAITFASTRPYARKIERGLSAQAPDGVYQAVAAVAKARFGNMAAIKFTYVPLPRRGSGRDSRGRFTRGEGDRAAAAREHASRQPAILIRPYR